MQKLKNYVSELNQDELFELVFKDALTGAYNRLAFEMKDESPIAIIDLDSLKYINDNVDHRTGDLYLMTLVDMLSTTFQYVYRLSGDEFVVSDKNQKLIEQKLSAIQFNFPCFSFGVGTNVKEADDQLKKSKQYRERVGLRASRGETPPWVAKDKPFYINY